MSNIPLQTREELLELILALKGTDDPDLSTAPGDDAHLDANALAHVAVRQQATIRELDEQLTPKAATGTYLDRHGECHMPPEYSARLPATAWYGIVRLTNTGSVNVLVPSGAQMSHADGNLYETTADVTVPAAPGTADVTARSTTTGESATKADGTSLTLLSPPAGISNQAIVVDTTTASEDTEGDEDYRTRLLIFTQESPGAGNAAHYRFWIRSQERDWAGSIDKVYVYKRWFGRGTVYVVPLGESAADSEDGQTHRILDPLIIDEIQDALDTSQDEDDGPVPSGVEATVEAPVTFSRNVLAGIEPEQGYEPDFEGTYTVATSVGGDPKTRIRLTAAPTSITPSEDKVVCHFGTGPNEVVLQRLVVAKGTNYVDVEGPEGTLPDYATVGTTLRAGGPLWQPMRDAVQAAFDELGPSRSLNPDLSERDPDPDAEDYPELTRAALIAALKDVTGAKNVTLTTPAADQDNAVFAGESVGLFMLGLFDLIWT